MVGGTGRAISTKSDYDYTINDYTITGGKYETKRSEIQHHTTASTHIPDVYMML